MQRNTERLVIHFDLVLSGYAVGSEKNERHEGLTPLTLEAILTMADALFKNDKLVVRPGKYETLYLADLQLDLVQGACTLLINRSDKLAPDPVFSDPTARRRRTAEKVENEGGDFSCHIAVKLKAHLPDRYRLVMEVTPGLSSQRVAAFLRSLTHACWKANKGSFLTNYPVGAIDPATKKPAQVRLRHDLRLVGHPSSQFVQELDGGKLLGIELVREDHRNELWDTNGYVVEHVRSVKLKQSVNGIMGSKFQAVIDVAKTAYKKNYSALKVVYKTAAGVSRTVDLDTQTQALASDLKFIRKDIISGFAHRLPTSFEKVNAEIRDRMLPLLR